LELKQVLPEVASPSGNELNRKNIYYILNTHTHTHTQMTCFYTLVLQLFFPPNVILKLTFWKCRVFFKGHSQTYSSMKMYLFGIIDEIQQQRNRNTVEQ